MLMLNIGSTYLLLVLWSVALQLYWNVKGRHATLRSNTSCQEPVLDTHH